MPDWFIKKIEKTWMISLPGQLFLPYYTLTLAETAIVVGLLISLFKKEGCFGISMLLGIDFKHFQGIAGGIRARMFRYEH